MKKTISAVTPESAKHLQERDDWNTSIQRGDDFIPEFEPPSSSHLKTLQAAPSPLKRTKMPVRTGGIAPGGGSKGAK